jgi:hypothetical protein
LAVAEQDKRLVLTSGRPVGLGPAANADAVLMAYQGSTETGQVVADVLFGKVNPGGKLPISWPSDAPTVGGDFDGTSPSPLGDQPKFFDQLPGTDPAPACLQPAVPLPVWPVVHDLPAQRALRHTQRVVEPHRNRRAHRDEYRIPGPEPTSFRCM